MFEKALQETFERIFDFKKVSYQAPGESREQECLFVEVELCRPHVYDGGTRARVEGKASIYVEGDKLPFGYFQKCIDAHKADAKKIFFFNIEENARLYQNIVQRGFSFVYFFDSQYDPALGSITSINIEVNS